MNIGKYETLIAVVESGSLTRAAQALGCTQSAVSHSIDSLEQELGFALLKRGRAGVRLTGEGERLLPAVRNLLNSAEQLAQTAASAARTSSPASRRAAPCASAASPPLPCTGCRRC